MPHFDRLQNQVLVPIPREQQPHGIRGKVPEGIRAILHVHYIIEVNLKFCKCCCHGEPKKKKKRKSLKLQDTSTHIEWSHPCSMPRPPPLSSVSVPLQLCSHVSRAPMSPSPSHTTQDTSSIHLVTEHTSPHTITITQHTTAPQLSDTSSVITNTKPTPSISITGHLLHTQLHSITIITLLHPSTLPLHSFSHALEGWTSSHTQHLASKAVPR